MKRTIITIVSVVILASVVSGAASAQGPVTPPPPPPVVTPPPVDPLAAAKAIDEANARADQWQQVAANSAASAQASINNAVASIASAQAGVNQMKVALQQSEAAKIAAQQGQIAQAVASAQAAQLSGAQAVNLASVSSQSAMLSLKQSGDALRGVSELRSNLTVVTADRNAARSEIVQINADLTQREKDLAAVASALVMERQRSSLYLNVAISFFLLLLVVIICIALLLWRIVLALRPAGRNKMIVVNERGQVQAQIEALS